MCCAAQRYTMLCYATLCFAMLCFAMWCLTTMLHLAVLRFAVLRYAVLRRAFPCRASPCHASPIHYAIDYVALVDNSFVVFVRCAVFHCAACTIALLPQLFSGAAPQPPATLRLPPLLRRLLPLLPTRSRGGRVGGRSSFLLFIASCFVAFCYASLRVFFLAHLLALFPCFAFWLVPPFVGLVL